MLSDEKGIASAELIFVTVVFLIIAGGLINLTSSGMDKAETGNLGQARMAGEIIAGTINTVYINGNGYSANVTLPDLKSDYVVYIYSNGNISVVYNNNNMTIKLIPTSNIESFNMSNGATYQVTNDNGNITFT